MPRMNKQRRQDLPCVPHREDCHRARQKLHDCENRSLRAGGCGADRAAQKWLFQAEPYLCEAAAVVHCIFRMVIDGKGVYQIADILSEEKVLCPSAYLAAKGVGNRRNNKFEDPYRWWGTGEVFAGGSTRTIY